MKEITPKQREIRERELMILDKSREAIIRDGYHGLNMDRIAEEIKSSKGTVYNHFKCKEEIIIALALQTMEKRVALLRKPLSFVDLLVRE